MLRETKGGRQTCAREGGSRCIPMLWEGESCGGRLGLLGREETREMEEEGGRWMATLGYCGRDRERWPAAVRGERNRETKAVTRACCGSRGGSRSSEAPTDDLLVVEKKLCARERAPTRPIGMKEERKRNARAGEKTQKEEEEEERASPCGRE